MYFDVFMGGGELYMFSTVLISLWMEYDFDTFPCLSNEGIEWGLYDLGQVISLLKICLLICRVVGRGQMICMLFLTPGPLPCSF